MGNSGLKHLVAPDSGSEDKVYGEDWEALADLLDALLTAEQKIAYANLVLTNSIVNGDIAPTAAIAYSKLALANSIVDGDISPSAAISKSKLAALNIVDADIAAGAAIAKSKLAALAIVNADIDAAAAIAYSKMDLANAIINADIAPDAAIAKTKLAALNIVDADVAAGAAIAKSKLAALNIVDADIAAGAAIAESKLADLSASKITSGIFPGSRGGLGKVLNPTWTNDYILVYKVAGDQWMMEPKPGGGSTTYSGSWTIPAGSTSVNVTHGIGIAPDINKIGLTPKDNLGGRSFWVEAHPTNPELYFVVKIAAQDNVAHSGGWRY